MVTLLYDVSVVGIHFVVHSLPVVVPVACLAFLAAALRLRRLGAMTGARLASSAVICVYGAGVLNAVLLPFAIVVGSARDDLASWRVFVNLVPVSTALQDPIGIVLNAALFVPLGMILPLVLRPPTAWRVLTVGFFISLAIELVQLLADVTVSSGRIADVDDLLGNTAGVLIGCLLFRIVMCLPGADRAAAAVRWPSSRTADAGDSSRVITAACIRGSGS